ncbi:YrhB domain-containing protein [Aquabacterium sp.]|uniref:YrhB domain-containing protein n=1 Tax=Aquabacterium sp. TaxID=1872578 RepID=UPI0025C6E8E4|nr:YrhB domain-containing protein [Aquabacterium sp.]
MSEIHEPEAVEIASDRLTLIAAEVGDVLELLPDQTIRAAGGWIFFYNTQSFARSGNPLDGLAGNGPLYVTRWGVLHELGTALPWLEAIEALGASR